MLLQVFCVSVYDLLGVGGGWVKPDTQLSCMFRAKNRPWHD